jgi:FkbM family methyltransferase
MFRNIIEKKRLMEEVMFEELSTSTAKIIFYGTSSSAKKYYKKFNDKGLLIDKVIVSQEYYKKNAFFYENKVHNSTIFLRDNTEKINLIIYFGINEKLLHEIKKSDLIEKYYLVDGGVAALGYIPHDYINKYRARYTKTYNTLSDTLSRQTMIGFLNTRIDGNASHINKYCVDEGYFPANLVELGDDEVYIDCGAYDGDTLSAFIKEISMRNKKYKRIYALEPDPVNYDRLEENCGNLKAVTLLKMGAYDENTMLSFSNEATGASHIDKEGGGVSIFVDRLDNIVSSEEKVTFIKMDLEGSELQALKGAKEIIKRCRPTLAVSVYHKKEDLMDIPEYLKQIYPGYRFYLRALCYDSIDVTLFALPESVE